jgi:hypothetical protein
MGAVDRQLHLVPGAHQALGDAGADPVAAPVATSTERPSLTSSRSTCQASTTCSSPPRSNGGQ